MKKIVSFLLIAALIFSFVPFGVFAAEIVSISYTPADENAYTFYVGENAELKHDDATDTDYYYYIINFFVGDKLTVNYSDDTSKDYVAEFIDGELYFVNGDEKYKQWEDITREEDQQTNHWGAGDHTFYIVFNGFRAPLTATVKENPIASISYTPKDGAITRYFETGGFFDTDINGSPYYYYNAHEISAGDILTVNYNDGRGTVLYMLTYEGDARYVSTTDRNDIIPGDSVSFFNEQRNKPFTLGEDNCIYAEYMGKRAPVKVKIVANPISAVVYTPANEITVTEYTDGEWVTEGDDTYYRYNTPWFKHGDRLEVTYTESGETVVYTYYTSYNGEPLYDRTGFYDEEQIQMPNEDTLFTRHRGKWVTGGDNYMSVYYMDNESNSVRVNIVENPVKAIRFERKNDTVLTENVDTYFDDYDQRSYYLIPHHRDGDRLTVIDKYGAEKVYEYNGFDAYICEGEENISAEEVHFRNDQHENPWGVGEHQYAVEYSGCEYLLTATVVENTVTRIEYIPKNAFNVIENTHGGYDAAYGYYRYWYQWSGAGDKLVVYDKNTGRTEYEYKIIDEDNWESAFVSESGDTISPEKITFEDDQYKNPWTVGNENYYYAVYMGARYPLVATIRDNPVKAIRYIPVKTPEVMTRYQSYYDEELGYEIYNLPRFNEGDKLIVTDKNSIDKTYVAERKYYSDIVFVSDDGDEISEYDIDRESNQHITPWHLGDGNEYFVEYLGVTCPVNCTVVDNPVASIEYIPANPISFYERTGGWFDERDNRYYYDTPGVGNGDKLVVTYSDERGTIEYTARYNQGEYGVAFVSDTGETLDTAEKFSYYSDQWETPWTLGTNYYTVTYCGVETQVPVLIKENNIAGITYTPVSMPQIWVTDYETVANSETGEVYVRYNIPNFREGDVLTIHYNDETSEDFVLTFDERDGESYFESTTTTDRYHRYKLYPFDKQYEQPWKFGAGNYYYIDFYGYTAPVEVEIIDSDVESIKYTPISDIVIDEKTGGEYVFDDLGEDFYYYHNESIIRPGDKLTVVYKNGNTVEYTLDVDPISEAWHLKSQTGEELNLEEIDLEDHQWENHWKPGVNYFDIKYHGAVDTVPVTINALYIPGDINGDNKVNNKDLTRLFQYLSDWDVEVNEPALDVNGDGKVNNKDLTRLFQYLSDWDVEIF